MGIIVVPVVFLAKGHEQKRVPPEDVTLFASNGSPARISLGAGR